MRIIILIFSLCFASSVFAQQGIFGENSVVYKSQREGGIVAYTNGWGADFAFGKHVDGFRRRMIHLEITSLKHPKQIRSYNPFYEDARSYFYGKLNSVFTIKSTWGYKKVLFDRLRSGGVQISRRWAMGPTLAFEKPIYLQIGKPELPYDYLEEERYNPEIHGVEDIYGRAPFYLGIDAMKLVPGIHAKYMVHFEWSKFGVDKPNTQAIEFGVSGSAYARPIKMMATEKNSQLFINLILSLKMGRKYVD